MNTQAAIDRSDLFRRQLTAATGGRDVPKSGGKTEAAACFQLALEHHAATCCLVNYGFLGTAFALNRIIYETAVRGLWLLFADDEAIERFRSDKRPPEIRKMLEEAVLKAGWQNAAELLDTHTELYRTLSDLTHAGPRALSFRISEDEIIGCYGLDDAVGVLDQADRHLNYILLGYLSLWNDPALGAAFGANLAEWQSSDPYEGNRDGS